MMELRARAAAFLVTTAPSSRFSLPKQAVFLTSASLLLLHNTRLLRYEDSKSLAKEREKRKGNCPGQIWLLHRSQLPEATAHQARSLRSSISLSLQPKMSADSITKLLSAMQEEFPPVRPSQKASKAKYAPAYVSYTNLVKAASQSSSSASSPVSASRKLPLPEPLAGPEEEIKTPLAAPAVGSAPASAKPSPGKPGFTIALPPSPIVNNAELFSPPTAVEVVPGTIEKTDIEPRPRMKPHSSSISSEGFSASKFGIDHVLLTPAKDEIPFFLSKAPSVLPDAGTEVMGH